MPPPPDNAAHPVHQKRVEPAPHEEDECQIVRELVELVEKNYEPEHTSDELSYLTSNLTRFRGKHHHDYAITLEVNPSDIPPEWLNGTSNRARALRSMVEARADASASASGPARLRLSLRSLKRCRQLVAYAVGGPARRDDVRSRSVSSVTSTSLVDDGVTSALASMAL